MPGRTRRIEDACRPAEGWGCWRSRRPSGPTTIRPPLSTRSGLTPKNPGFHRHQIGQLAHLHRAHLAVDAVGDGRVDRVLGDVALQACVVVAPAVPAQGAPLHLHLVGRLEGADDHLPDPAHRLGVAGDDAEMAPRSWRMSSAAIVSRRMRIRRRPRPPGCCGIEVVAHHQHVEVLLQRVERVGPRGLVRAGQHVGFAADADDVRRVAAAGPLGVEGVDRAARRWPRSCPPRSPPR